MLQSPHYRYEIAVKELRRPRGFDRDRLVLVLGIVLVLGLIIEDPLTATIYSHHEESVYPESILTSES